MSSNILAILMSIMHYIQSFVRREFIHGMIARAQLGVMDLMHNMTLQKRVTFNMPSQKCQKLGL